MHDSLPGKRMGKIWTAVDKSATYQHDRPHLSHASHTVNLSQPHRHYRPLRHSRAKKTDPKQGQ